MQYFDYEISIQPTGENISMITCIFQSLSMNQWTRWSLWSCSSYNTFLKFRLNSKIFTLHPLLLFCRMAVFYRIVDQSILTHKTPITNSYDHLIIVGTRDYNFSSWCSFCNRRTRTNKSLTIGQRSQKERSRNDLIVLLDRSINPEWHDRSETRQYVRIFRRTFRFLKIWMQWRQSMNQSHRIHGFDFSIQIKAIVYIRRINDWIRPSFRIRMSCWYGRIHLALVVW